MPFDLSTAVAIGLYLLLAFLPGYGASRALGFRHRDPLVAAGVAAGMGLALQPVVFLWSRVVGLHLGRAALWAVLVVSALVLAATIALERRESPGLSAVPVGRPDAVHLAMLFVLALVAASRWWAAQGLIVPLWGDSVHHTMIVELLRRGGGLVADWRPLAELSTFTYHFGFHAGAVSLSWLSGLPSHTAVLVAGQVLSVLGVLTSYALAAGLTNRRWAGVGAALAAGGLATMPAYYLNWGRYTQLAGQVVLPVAALVAVWAAAGGLEGDPVAPSGAAGGARRGNRWRAVFAASLVAAGLFLTHYLISLFLALFLVAWLAVAVRPGVRSRRWAGDIVGLVAVAGLSLAVVAPWFPQLAQGPLGEHALRLATSAIPNPSVAGVVAPSYVWGSLDLHMGWGLVAAYIVAGVWGVLRRRRVAILGLLWSALLLAAAYPGLFGVQVTGLLKDFTVVIGFYVPAGLVIGSGLGELSAVLAERARFDSRLAAAAVVTVALGLAWKDAHVVAADSVYVTAEDYRAMTWIREHTPATAVFLVGTFSAFGDTIVVGEDAGWWIPLLTGRGATAPPATVGTERAFDDYRERMNDLNRLWHTDMDSPESLYALELAGVTHAYVGRRAARMREQGLGGRLIDRLRESPYWHVVYDGDGVAIYRFDGQDVAKP